MNSNLHLAVAHDRRPALLARAAHRRLVREATAADRRRHHFGIRRSRGG